MEQLINSPKTLGHALKRQRKLKKLNQKEAGAAFNMSQDTVSSVEQGSPGTRLETLFRLLAALDLEMVIRSKKTINTKKSEQW